MIVSDLPNGAAVWQPTTQAPEAIQKSTANIFNALFTSPPIAGPSQSTNRAVTINDAMQELQKTLPTKNQKNIAFAHVIAASGNNKIYVSVSGIRSEEHTSELQSLMRISYAVFCLKQKHNIQLIIKDI